MLFSHSVLAKGNFGNEECGFATWSRMASSFHPSLTPCVSPLNICLSYLLTQASPIILPCPQAPVDMSISAARRNLHPVEKSRKSKEIW